MEADGLRLGPYNVFNCKSRNQHMFDLIKRLRSTLQPAITDLNSSPSSAAYTTFFKNVAYVPYVRDVLSNITNGASIPSKSKLPPQKPAIYCIDALDQITWTDDDTEKDAWAFCQTHNIPPHRVPVLILLPYPWIAICPTFWHDPALPDPSPSNCYDIHPHRSDFFRQDGKSLLNFRFWHLFHELVHYYVYATRKAYRDVYGINQCLELAGPHAIENPASYTYYATNVRMGCTEFPTVDTRPARGGGVELLETYDNQTDVSEDEPVALEVEDLSAAASPLINSPVPTSLATATALNSNSVTARKQRKRKEAPEEASAAGLR
ncbi:MAG: hypothetical protein LQ352_007317 [Teloschistes flavicans]|nr:MAG: hypothetical protein LQ352_007317 [Teloschistes flavicans]